MLMSVFDNSMKSFNVLENDPYDWERSDSDGLLSIQTLATTAQQLTRLTPAYMGYAHDTLHFFFTQSANHGTSLLN